VTEQLQKIREKGADYVLALKNNQPMMYEEVEEYFKWLEREQPKDEWSERWESKLEKGHGRIEKREITIASGEWMDEKENWEDLTTIIKCKSMRIVNEEKTINERYYISSFEGSAENFGEIIRSHRSIENRLHWVLDVTFREDAGRARKDNAPLNMNILRKIASTLLKKLKVGRLSTRKKMYKAAMNPRFLEKILFKVEKE
jgi:predicted transposase YbfD/YdcC